MRCDLCEIAHTVTFYLKSPPQTDSFGTRGCLGRGAWLWTRGRAEGHADRATRGGRPSERGQTIGYCTIGYCGARY
ncbi:hypothetical protein OAO87_02155 [bacterium]|nr:hypothetical protein [bacterium]